MHPIGIICFLLLLQGLGPLGSNVFHTRTNHQFIKYLNSMNGSVHEMAHPCTMRPLKTRSDDKFMPASGAARWSGSVAGEWKRGIVVDALWRTLLAVLPQNYAEGLLNTDCVPSRCVSDTGKHCMYFFQVPCKLVRPFLQMVVIVCHLCLGAQ